MAGQNDCRIMAIMITCHLQHTSCLAGERNTLMPADDPFNVLELSLSCSFPELAKTLLDMDTDEERKRSALLAVGFCAHRFTNFTESDILWRVCEHMRHMEYDKLEQELVAFAEAYQAIIDQLTQEKHMLVTELAQARKDVEHWRALCQPDSDYISTRTYSDLSPIRNIMSDKTDCKSQAKRTRVTKRKQEP